MSGDVNGQRTENQTFTHVTRNVPFASLCDFPFFPRPNHVPRSGLAPLAIVVHIVRAMQTTRGSKDSFIVIYFTTV